MRILLLNYEYPPLGGGAGVATAELARRLVARGATVDVVTTSVAPPRRNAAARGGPSANGSGAAPTLHRVRSWRRGVHEAGLAGATGYLASAVPVIRRLARSRSYDVAHLFFSLPTGVLLPVAAPAGIPTVVSLRGSDVPGYDPRLNLLHRALRPLTRSIWRRADRVVALSENLGQLARRTEPGLRYSVIWNGVDTELFRPPAGPAAPECRMIRCLSVARLVDRKGLGDLLQAFVQLERGRYQLEIVGAGPRAGELRALADRLGLSGQVRFTGALDRRAVAERYRHADLFTLIPMQESFGNVFAEALASGLPIVGSDAGGIPEFVEHGRNGLLVTPGDPRTIARAIRLLADDPDLRARMAAENRLKAETALSWDRTAERYVEIYEELLGTRRPMAPRTPAVATAA